MASEELELVALPASSFVWMSIGGPRVLFRDSFRDAVAGFSRCAGRAKASSASALVTRWLMFLEGSGAVFCFVSNAKSSPDSCRRENSSIEGNLLAISSTVGFGSKEAVESKAENGSPSVTLNGEGLGLATL